MKHIGVYFGSEALQRDFEQADIGARLIANGYDVLHLPSQRVTWLRRGPLRTLIYADWANQGSTTAKTKLKRRRAIRQRIGATTALLVDRHVVNGTTLARAVEALRPIPFDAEYFVQHLDLLVVATDIYRGQETDLIKAAQKNDVPTLGIVGSWDTLTSKGYYLVEPDDIAVWGEASARHAIERHGFHKDRVHVIGSLRLDPGKLCYAMPDILRFDQPPVVMVAGTSIAYMAHEEAMVDQLAAVARKEQTFRVWYRPHPRRINTVSDRSALALEWLKKGVYFDMGAADRDEHPGFLSMVLSRSRVVVSAFSTLVIQAALQGTPSILVAFGPSTGGMEGNDTETGSTLLDHASFDHMREIADWVHISTAKSQPELMDMVRHEVHFPIARAAQHELREQAKEVAGPADGRSADRMLNLILAKLKK